MAILWRSIRYWPGTGNCSTRPYVFFRACLLDPSKIHNHCIHSSNGSLKLCLVDQACQRGTNGSTSWAVLLRSTKNGGTPQQNTSRCSAYRFAGASAAPRFFISGHQRFRRKGHNSSKNLRNLLDLGLAIGLLELGKLILLFQC